MKAQFVNENIKHLSPKSEEEIKKLEKRGFIEKKGKWQFKIDISLVMKKSEEDADTEEFRKGMSTLLRSKQEDIAEYLGEDEAIEYENLTEEFDMLDSYPDEDEIDYVLQMLYDWADDNNIWIESFDF